MSRNASGNYALPDPETPFLPNTVISSTDVNTVMSDIATELTASLDRGGRGGMTAPLVMPAGSAAAPAVTFSGDTDTGVYAAAANTLGFATGGAVRATLASGQLLTIDGAMATPALSFISDPDSGIYRANANDIRVATNGTDRLAITTNLTVTAATAATGAARQNALVLANGDLDLSGVAYPTSTTAITNKLTPGNICKAWVRATINGGNGSNFTTSVTAGFNITSIARASATTLTITFASVFANTNYLMVGALYNALIGDIYQLVPSLSVGSVTISLLPDDGGAVLDMDAASGSNLSGALHIAFFGQQ